jgi:hypothetical protein
MGTARDARVVARIARKAVKQEVKMVKKAARIARKPERIANRRKAMAKIVAFFKPAAERLLEAGVSAAEDKLK